MQDSRLIHIDCLHKDFVMGDQVVHALDDITLDIPAGQFLGVMGPSGSGKSTLLHLIGGLDRPSSGEIWVNGDEITRLDENDLAVYRGRQVGFIFQSFHLIPTMTALQNVEFPMIFERMPPRQRRERALALLGIVGLDDRVSHRPTELSGGQQQRVALARALANDPAIILADEPTGNLDSHRGAEIMALLKQLNVEQGRTVIVVSHDPMLEHYATHQIHLLDGKIVNHTSV
ncbi:MAG: ABC transporter ATP-binding protein [Anaerolineae bacterium]|nr:ABC transporter ATP-binding protein [Anaerolineae bacterium]